MTEINSQGEEEPLPVIMAVEYLNGLKRPTDPFTYDITNKDLYLFSEEALESGELKSFI